MSKAANVEHIDFQVILGTMYENGQGVVSNFYMATYWYNQATNQGDSEAESFLIELYKRGYIVPSTIIESSDDTQKCEICGMEREKSIFKDCPCCGDNPSKWGIPFAITNGETVGYMDGAMKGYAEDQFNLGWCYQNGEGGLPQNDEYAAFWMGKAAAKGYPDAQFTFGMFFKTGCYVPQNYEIAVYWLEKAAAQGDHDALNSLGMCYRQGKGVEFDLERAIELFEESAEQDDVNAEFNLGMIYLGVDGNIQDYNKAFKWLTRAANNGHAGAQNALGVMYLKGVGISQDIHKAKIWIEKAASNGEPAAAHILRQYF